MACDRLTNSLSFFKRRDPLPRHLDLIDVPDLNNPPLWAGYVRELFGPLDYFVSGNELVNDVLSKYYKVIAPKGIIIAPDISATLVRNAILNDEDWERFVPDPVVGYLCSNKLVDRFLIDFK